MIKCIFCEEHKDKEFFPLDGKSRCNECSVKDSLFHYIVLAKTALKLNILMEEFKRHSYYTHEYIKFFNTVSDKDVEEILNSKKHEETWV